MIGLKRKFGPTLADVIHYEENAEKECTSLKNLIYENKEMQEKYKLLTEAVMKKAEALIDNVFLQAVNLRKRSYLYCKIWGWMIQG